MSEGEIVRTSKEVREDNKMLRFQVEVLWKNLKEERTRREQAVHSSRESVRMKQVIMDALKAENARLIEQLEPVGWAENPGYGDKEQSSDDQPVRD